MSALPNPWAWCAGATAHFIDPKLRLRLVRMQVMDAGCKSHDLVAVDCDRKMVARVAEELLRNLLDDRIVEHVRRDVRKDGALVAPQNPDFNRHGESLLRPPPTLPAPHPRTLEKYICDGAAARSGARLNECRNLRE